MAIHISVWLLLSVLACSKVPTTDGTKNRSNDTAGNIATASTKGSFLLIGVDGKDSGTGLALAEEITVIGTMHSVGKFGENLQQDDYTIASQLGALQIAIKHGRDRPTARFALEPSSSYATLNGSFGDSEAKIQRLLAGVNIEDLLTIDSPEKFKALSPNVRQLMADYGVGEIMARMPEFAKRVYFAETGRDTASARKKASAGLHAASVRQARNIDMVSQIKYLQSQEGTPGEAGDWVAIVGARHVPGMSAEAESQGFSVKKSYAGGPDMEKTVEALAESEKPQLKPDEITALRTRPRLAVERLRYFPPEDTPTLVSGPAGRLPTGTSAELESPDGPGATTARRSPSTPRLLPVIPEAGNAPEPESPRNATSPSRRR